MALNDTKSHGLYSYPIFNGLSVTPSHHVKEKVQVSDNMPLTPL